MRLLILHFYNERSYLNLRQTQKRSLCCEDLRCTYLVQLLTVAHEDLPVKLVGIAPQIQVVPHCVPLVSITWLPKTPKKMLVLHHWSLNLLFYSICVPSGLKRVKCTRFPAQMLLALVGMWLLESGLNVQIFKAALTPAAS